MNAYDELSDMVNTAHTGTATCPLCGKTGRHDHTPEELIIFRNGMKYADGSAALQSRLSAPVGDEVAYRTYDRMGYYVISPSLEEAERDFPGKEHTPLYTHPAPDAVRRETVEACAKVCEQFEGREYDPWDYAAAIRAMLKGE